MPAVLENAYPWSPPGDSAAKLRKIWALEPCCCRKTLWLPFPQLPTWQGCQTPAPSLSTPVSIPTISPCSQGFLSYFIFTPSPPARSFLRFCKKKKNPYKKRASFACIILILQIVCISTVFMDCGCSVGSNHCPC